MDLGEAGRVSAARCSCPSSVRPVRGLHTHSFFGLGEIDQEKKFALCLSACFSVSLAGLKVIVFLYDSFVFPERL